MDKFDKSHSDGTYRVMRAEHLIVAVVCAVLAIVHFDEIDAVRFAALFLLIDVVGYLPGIVAHLRSRTGTISPVYHGLYNLTHSYVTWAAIGFAWWLAFGWDWTLLAIPIHLSGDRGVFGNVLKPADRPFEPSLRVRST